MARWRPCATCHLRPARAIPVLETGANELVMCASNFVDVHTYNFEGTVFGEAARVDKDPGRRRGEGSAANSKAVGAGTLRNGGTLRRRHSAPIDPPHAD